ncbi:MAG: hypothetical protein E7562_01925 [Ruminococcaceae bacterium]|nr:hypothetical protein [Oscillospiraceae bacterium]
MKYKTKKAVSLFLTVTMLMTALFSVDFSAVFAVGETATQFAFDSIDEIKENFVSFYAPNGKAIEAVDENGNSLYKECDPSLTWSAADGILKRTGNGVYAAGAGRNGAGSLYFKDFYKNFEVEYDYYIGGLSSYRWAGLGFGASQIGNHYIADGYYTYVEKEGRIRLYNESTSAPAIQNTTYSDFQTYCTTVGNWVHFKASVLDGVLNVTYTYTINGQKKSVTGTKTLSESYNGGYVYLSCYTQNMQFKNLTIKKLQSYDPTYTTEYVFDDMSVVTDNFTSYSFSNTEDFGAKDENGVSLIDKTDASLVWRINEENQALERYGTGEYAGGRGHKGAALLYFNEKYDDFVFSVKYRFSSTSTNSSYKWIGLGFGAENIGDCFQKDSYFAVVQQEGEIFLHLKRTAEQSALARHNGKQVSEYNEQVKTNLNTSIWHTLNVRVVGNSCFISFDGNDEYKVSIAQDTTGYMYLFANTQYLQLKDVRVTRIPGANDAPNTATNIEVWPEEYEVDSYISSAVSGISKGSTKFSFKTTVNGNSVPVSVSFPKDGGVRITGQRTGFFEPKALNTITYQEVSGGINLTSGNETVKFRYDTASWQIITQKNGADSLALSSDNLSFGYKDGKIARIKYSFPINSGEKLYGLGERYNAVNQNGYTVTLWNHDPTYHTGGATGDKTDSYANVPVLHSTNGYTLFINSTYYAEADIGYTNASSYSFDFNGDIFDLYIWNGTPADNMQSYTQITGKPYVPPKWAFGYWAGSARGLYDTAIEEAEAALPQGETLTADAKKQVVADKVQNVLDNYAAMGTMPYAYYGEGEFIDNSALTFPLLQSYGIKPLSWSRCSTTYNNVYDYLMCDPLDLPLIMMKNDPLKYFGSIDKAYIDFTNPLSSTLVKNLYTTRVSHGMRGYMVDMGEYIGTDTAFFNGMDGDEMHNLYSYYYAKAHNEAMSALLDDDFVLFERSGSAGSWQYAMTFGGDQAAQWYGIRQQLNGMLTGGASGFSIYGADIGGLHGRPTDELYTRWVQFSAFSPVMREHGNTSTDMLPWTYSADAKQNFINYYNVREVLIDHIYSGALKSGNTGIPMVQTLAMAYPGDNKLIAVEDEYVFCDNMLVAPIVTKGAVSRNVVLPNGTWYDFWSGKKLSGGITVSSQGNSNTIPVYLKSGTVTPLNLSDELSFTKSGERKTLLVTAPETDNTATVLTSAENGFEYVLDKVSDTAFTLKKDKSDGYSTVIVYGFKATSVNADGTELSAENFYVDGENTVITLPSSAVETVEIYSKGVLVRNNITEISPLNVTELNSLITYSADSDHYIEEYDENGESVFKQVNTSDVWCMPYEGVIERQAISDYVSSSNKMPRKAASALYLDGEYTDFELEFSYCYNYATTSWRWVSAGFGAERVGKSYYDSGYLGLVEQEGTLKIIGDVTAERTVKTYNLKSTKETGYPLNDVWYTYRLRVVDGTATLWFGDSAYSYKLSNYNGGKVYLHCFTNNIRFKDIRITDLSTIIGEEDRFEVSVSNSVTGGKITTDKTNAKAGAIVKVSCEALQGYKLLANSVTVMGYGENGIINQVITPDINGDYSFVMPEYPVVITANYYKPYDANRDGKTDVRDLVRIKRHLATTKIMLDEAASDTDLNGEITANDALLIRKMLLGIE